MAAMPAVRAAAAVATPAKRPEGSADCDMESDAVAASAAPRSAEKQPAAAPTQEVATKLAEKGLMPRFTLLLVLNYEMHAMQLLLNVEKTTCNPVQLELQSSLTHLKSLRRNCFTWLVLIVAALHRTNLDVVF